MRKPLRVLILEDNEADAELMVHELRRAGFDPTWSRVDTEVGYRQGLDDSLDIILADYSQPQFDALRALAVLRERGLEVPFIVVTGALGDEAAAACIKEGATDYLIKDRLARLGPAVDHALDQAMLRADQRRATRDLRQSEERLSLVVEGSGASHWDFDLALDRVYRGPRAAEMLGYTPDEIPPTLEDWQALIHPEDREIADTSLRGHLEGHIAQYSSEHRMLTKSGQWIWVAERGRVVARAADGLPLRAAGTYQEITKRKELEMELDNHRNHLEHVVAERTSELTRTVAQLRESALRLEIANRHKSRFLATMSHELRTPLTAILGFADLLEHQMYGPLNVKQMGYVRSLRTSGQHLLALITDLLDLARIDAGAMELDISVFPFDAVRDSALAMVRVQAAKKGVTLQAPASTDLQRVRADRRRVLQILVNLLTNAVKFTPDGGTISVSATQGHGGFLRVEVADTGIGIGGDDVSRVFDEFYQADLVRNEAVGGAGIGLALVRRLAQLHAGEVGVESQVGKGSRFWFTVPTADAAPRPSEAQAEPVRCHHIADGLSVLIAEDDPTTAHFVADMLRGCRHTVRVASNGRAAVEMVTLARPDLVIMDVKMPEMDGFAATRQIRALPGCANTPIIALTALADPETRAACLDAGCDECLTKPVSTAELLGAVDRCVFGDVAAVRTMSAARAPAPV